MVFSPPAKKSVSVKQDISKSDCKKGVLLYRVTNDHVLETSDKVDRSEQ